MSDRMASLQTELDRTTRRQADAADPAASVWVSANAGTGKTHVLTMRVLRLLLANTPPQRILCLTYTKAAAAEMSKRVFDSLARWVMLPDAELARVLREFLGRDPSTDETALARTLFTRATETPGGLAVQTIHAFAERLLQRFPLEAGVTPGFSILDDDTARKLMREATDHVIGDAARSRASVLGRALETAIAYAADDRFDDILGDALRERDWLEA
ncbi:UvrD-helicase domain-containing protein, partial [uncultured Hyphomicrobium sp.]